LISDRAPSPFGDAGNGEHGPRTGLEIAPGTALRTLPCDESEAPAPAQAQNDGLDYWRHVLRGERPVLQLPADLSRPAAPAGRVASFDVALTAERTAQLADLGARAGVTPFTTLLAGFAVLLARTTGQNEIRVGTLLAGRPNASEGPLAAPADTLVLRVHVAPDDTFAEALANVHTAAQAMLAHADVPFERLVQAEAGAGARNPFFDILFDAGELAPAASRALPFDPAAARFARVALTLALRTQPAGSLSCSFTYDAEVFEPATIETLAAHFCVLLTNVVNDSDAPVARLPLAGAAEIDTIVNVWSRPDPQPAIPPPGGDAQTIHALVAANAVQRPDATAVIEDGGEPVTYAELERRANRLAHALRARGVGRDVRVGMFIERSVDAVIAMLGTLKSGGAFVTLDPAYPAERTAHMLATAGVETIVTRRASFAALAGFGRHLIAIDDPGLLECAGDRGPESGAHPDSLAYVMFTSGSTGKPKAVPILHRGLIAMFTRTPVFACAPADNVLLHAALTFDASMLMTWAPLIYGARLAVMPAGPYSLAEFAAQLERYRISVVCMVAPLFHQFVEERIDALRGLNSLVVTGDVLSPARAQRFVRDVPGCRLYNGYGPTETTVAATLFAVLPDAPARRSVPIGRPCSEGRLYILDDLRAPVAIGVPGELWIGGTGVAPGYLDEPELTAARFVPDPFAGDPSARMYRSGDRARWLPGGDVEFLGRIDDQVKIRGFRVEPSEVEFALLEHPSVRHAAVVVRGNEPAERVLIGYAEVRDAALTEAALRAFLQTKLPEHAVPSRLALLERLPKTASGKVDRLHLPDPSAPVPAGETGPQSETEEIVAAILAHVLAVPSVGRSDDFFALGGHSLLATRVIARVAERFNVELSVRGFFKAPSAAGLAALIAQMQQRELRPSSVRRSAAPRPPALAPLCFAHGCHDGRGSRCLALAAELDGRPLVALTPQGAPGDALPPTIEAAAAANIARLESAQPDGPYLLGGCADGALVAFEMARQLTARGERVDNVFLVNAPPAGRRLPPIAAVSGIARLGESVLRYGARVRRFAATADKRPFLRVPAGTPAELAAAHRLAAWKQIVNTYAPRGYAGRTTVLFAEEEGRGAAIARSWLTVAAQAELRAIPGHRVACTDDGVRALARAIADAL
jgi:amino acid adenylation domain-containing protein